MNENEKRRHQSKVESYSHFVWATYQRQKVLTGEWEEAAHRCMRAEAARLGCKILALDGMPDHVHVVVRLHASVSCSKFANQVKGVSSALLNDLCSEETEIFRWQSGYASFSLSRSHLNRVVAYVDNQKIHHSNQDLWPEWEEVEET